MKCPYWDYVIKCKLYNLALADAYCSGEIRLTARNPTYECEFIGEINNSDVVIELMGLKIGERLGDALFEDVEDDFNLEKTLKEVNKLKVYI